MSSEYLDDPNVPEAVKKQLKAMQDTPQEPGNKPEDVITPPVEQPETVIPEQVIDKPGEKDVVIDVEPEADNKPSDTPAEEHQPEPQNVDYEQKYRSLKGKFDAEVPRLTKALGAKDDVINFYKRENQTLKEQLQSSERQPAQSPENFEISPEAQRQLAEAGYDDPEDLEAIRRVMFNETAALRKQAQNNQSFNAGSGCDGILLSNGFVDSRTMQQQPSYEYAMNHYGEFGISAAKLFDQAIERGDFENAACILSEIQGCMINEGLWQGTHPRMNAQPPKAPESPAEPPNKPQGKVKSVLPHNKTTTPAPKAPLLETNALEKASRDFTQGRISHAKYEKIKKEYLQQQSNLKT